MKTVTTTMLLTILLAVAGCGKQEDSDEERRPPRVSLHAAALQGNLNAIRRHINAGADMTITNNEGSTPLHIAAFLCRTEIVKALLDKGADKAIRNKAGRTALETVASPFDDVKGIYDGLGAALKPLGLRLDYERIKATRPKIAEMLRSYSAGRMCRVRHLEAVLVMDQYNHS